MAALFSHMLLDMVNGAVRLWLPFAGEWLGVNQSVEGNPLVIGVLLLCFLVNHPPNFRNSYNLGTLRLLNAIGAWLKRTIGSRITPEPLAALVLLCLGVYLTARMLF